MTISRFSFGYFTALIPVILNCIACVGWSVVNSIVGGQTLQAVSTSHQIPIAAAIVVIAVGTIIVSFMGYRVVHLYEKYSWIPVCGFSSTCLCLISHIIGLRHLHHLRGRDRCSCRCWCLGRKRPS